MMVEMGDENLGEVFLQNIDEMDLKVVEGVTGMGMRYGWVNDFEIMKEQCVAGINMEISGSKMSLNVYTDNGAVIVVPDIYAGENTYGEEARLSMIGAGIRTSGKILDVLDGLEGMPDEQEPHLNKAVDAWYGGSVTDDLPRTLFVDNWVFRNEESVPTYTNLRNVVRQKYDVVEAGDEHKMVPDLLKYKDAVFIRIPESDY